MARIIKARGERIIPAEAHDLLTRARRTLADAEAKAAAARQTAQQEGFEAGRQAGLATVTELIASARAAAVKDADAAAGELRRLAVKIAEKILGRELAASPDAIADVVRAALDAARARKELIVRVHPDDVAAVNAARARLAGALSPNAALAVRGDAEIARGGCQIDTEVGTIDARLDVQLAAIERALLGDDA